MRLPSQPALALNQPRAPRSRSLLLVLAPVALLALGASSARAQPGSPGELCEQGTDSTRYPRARAAMQTLIAAAPNEPTAEFLRGCVAFASGRDDEAINHLERVVRQNDDVGMYHDWLARVYGNKAQHVNRLRQAVLAPKIKSHFERAVQLDPDNMDARGYLVMFYIRAPGFMGGSFDRAREQVAEMRRRNPYRAALSAAAVATQLKDMAGAEHEYQGLLERYSDSTAGYYALVGLYRQQQQWDRAFAVAERLQKALPSNMVGAYLIGRLAAGSGQQLERGEQALRRYLSYTPLAGEPGLASAHYWLGGIMERRGQTDSAKHEYQQAVALAPNYKEAKDALARLR